MAAQGNMDLLDMLNLRLDYLLERAYSDSHYKKSKYAAKRLLDYLRNVPCSTITRLMADEFLMDRVKVDYYSFHRFRASGASVMDNNGALLPGIQRVLGHADRRSTEIYQERLRDVERDAMDDGKVA